MSIQDKTRERIREIMATVIKDTADEQKNYTDIMDEHTDEIWNIIQNERNTEYQRGYTNGITKAITETENKYNTKIQELQENNNILNKHIEQIENNKQEIIQNGVRMNIKGIIQGLIETLLDNIENERE